MSENNTTKKTKLFEGIGDTSSMDKPVSNDFKSRKKIIRYASIGLSVIAIILVFIFRDSSSKLNVEIDKITIDAVKQDIFRIIFP